MLLLYQVCQQVLQSVTFVGSLVGLFVSVWLAGRHARGWSTLQWCCSSWRPFAPMSTFSTYYYYYYYYYSWWCWQMRYCVRSMNLSSGRLRSVASRSTWAQVVMSSKRSLSISTTSTLMTSLLQSLTPVHTAMLLVSAAVIIDRLLSQVLSYWSVV